MNDNTSEYPQQESIDIEHLSKAQLILLTLFVSFITSIATGIVTVSLMNQAPPIVAQTVNRVVERTVEKVMPSGQSATVAITREKTVVVKDSDMLAQSVKKVAPSLVRLYSRNDESFIGFGVVTDSIGTIVSDNGALGEQPDVLVKTPDGTFLRAFVRRRDAGRGFAMLQAATSSNGSASSTPMVWTPAVIAIDPVRTGQSIAALAGRTVERVGGGMVTALVPVSNEGGALKVIDTDVSSGMVVPGTVLINTDGGVIGMSTTVSRDVAASGFISLSVLLSPSVSAEAAK